MRAAQVIAVLMVSSVGMLEGFLAVNMCEVLTYLCRWGSTLGSAAMLPESKGGGALQALQSEGSEGVTRGLAEEARIHCTACMHMVFAMPHNAMPHI